MPGCEGWTWVARRGPHSRADGMGERRYLGRVASAKAPRPPWGFPGGGRGTWKTGICRGLRDLALGKTQLQNDGGGGHRMLCSSVGWRVS